MKNKSVRFFLVIVWVFIALFALYLPKNNTLGLVLKVISIALLIWGVMKLMSKVPSKNNDDESV
jgi:predicted membrane channel-forming protein YqfA (hemolysin III family)